MGWGVDRYLMADLYDALNTNTAATGNWRRKPPAFPPWPRPSNKPDAPKRTSVKDLYKRFSGR